MRTDDWKTHPETKELVTYLEEVIKLWVNAWVTGSASQEDLIRGQHIAQAAYDFKEYIQRGEMVND